MLGYQENELKNLNFRAFTHPDDLDLELPLFNKLLDYQETSKQVYRSGNVSIKKHLNGGYFISSNFSNKDDIGRPMAFMFFTQNETKEKIIKELPVYLDPLAQLVEHLTFNQRVRGSNPLRVTIYAWVAELVDALDLKSNDSNIVPVRLRP